MFNKNDLFDVEIVDITSEGEGVGKKDGFTFFIKDTIIGDIITMRVTKLKKNYGYGRLEKIITASPDRVEPLCPLARSCGGCQIQEMSYESQLKFKQNKVYNNLLRLGGFDKTLLDSVMEPIIGAVDEGGDYTFGYRNKAQFPFGLNKEGEAVCGFYAGRTHSIISNTDCRLGVSENKDILETILSWMKKYNIKPYDEVTCKGYIRHALIRKGFRTGQIMICLVVNDDKLPKSKELVESLLALNDSIEATYGSRIKSISLSVNKEKTNVIMGDSYEVLWGEPVIEDIMNVGGKSLKFKISPLSFYQVNPIQVEKLYGTAIEFASLTGCEEVWDLCCGIGTITLAMANNASMVHGIEIVPQAIEDAKKNAVANGISNAEFICAPAEDYLPKHAATIKADVIVMDPPRKGMDEEALKVVVGAAPSKIVYVSCDSATLARDLKYLCSQGYELKRVRPCDMFCNTVHVETVALLVSETDYKVEIEVNADKYQKGTIKSTYADIRKYVYENTGLIVSTINIGDAKRKCGLSMQRDEELSGNRRKLTPEKYEAIKNAFEHFGWI